MQSLDNMFGYIKSMGTTSSFRLIYIYVNYSCLYGHKENKYVSCLKQ